MTLKTLTAALALVLLPTLSMAMGCSTHTSDQQAMSCAEGSQLDEETGTCVPLTTS